MRKPAHHLARGHHAVSKISQGLKIDRRGFLGAMAAAAALYRFGYDMVDKAYENAKKQQ